MVTRKDLEEIAEIIKGEYLSPDDGNQLWSVAHKIADYFESQNVRFNRDEFLKACAVE